MSLGCSKTSPKQTENSYCNYWDLTEFDADTPTTLLRVFRVGLNHMGWSNTGEGFMWNLANPGWKLCYTHWRVARQYDLFEELKKSG